MLNKDIKYFLESLPEHERIDLLEESAIVWSYSNCDPMLRDPLTEVIVKRYRREKESKRNSEK